MTLTNTVTDDIVACHQIRRTVFIDEQGVSEADERDNRDTEAVHLLALLDGVAIGTARMLIEGDEGKIGRVAILKEHRGEGYGKALMRAAVSELSSRGVARATLGSQTHAIGFYEALGFDAVGPEFDDAGIPHRKMVRDL